MDLGKAEKARDLLYKVDRMDGEVTSISICKSVIVGRTESLEKVQLDINGTEIKCRPELIIKFLEDVEKDIQMKKVEILGELTRL